MKQNKPKTNWFIDAALFGGFLLAQWLDLTGLPVHQWLGLGVAVLAGYHLTAHWSWVKAVTERFFGRNSRQARTFYAVDAGLAVGFAAILVTGLVISTWLDLSLASYAAWRTVHVAASVTTLGLVVAKIGLHWRWIVGVARRSIFPAPAPTGGAGAAQPMPVAARVNRRDFVRLMAGVGAMAVLAGANALNGSAGDQAEAAPEAQTPVGTQTQAVASTSASSASCTVRCTKRCSYPGHCRRYVDTNSNGKCDLGECLS
ncbi:MAG: DUF4405 domain-containing protein [Anaerolineae bacterium]|nr:DUF4405 domain-containing protein [Anaerolineae bacterium]